MYIRSGISLIVLIITIVVIIILTSAIVLNISSNNPINKASEAVFKSDMKNIQEELSMYISSNIQTDGTYRYPTKDQILSANKYSPDVLSFSKEKVVYKTNNINEKAQLESLGVVVDYTDGLLVNYKMNNVSPTDSVSGSTATNYVTSQTIDRFGKSNGAYSFNGTSSYMELGSNSSLNLTEALTVSSWIYVNSGATTGYVIAKNTLGPADHQYAMLWTPNTVEIYMNGGFILNFGANVISPGSWYNITLTWDKTNVKTYINGSKTAQTGFSTSLISSSSTVNIGRRKPNDYYFNGKIDDLRIYNRALSDSEVKSLYDVYWAD